MQQRGRTHKTMAMPSVSIQAATDNDTLYGKYRSVRDWSGSRDLSQGEANASMARPGSPCGHSAQSGAH